MTNFPIFTASLYMIDDGDGRPAIGEYIVAGKVRKRGMLLFTSAAKARTYIADFVPKSVHCNIYELVRAQVEDKSVPKDLLRFARMYAAQPAPYDVSAALIDCTRSGINHVIDIHYIASYGQREREVKSAMDEILK